MQLLEVPGNENTSAEVLIVDSKIEIPHEKGLVAEQQVLFQPLETIYAQCKVRVPIGKTDKREEISASIGALDELISRLSSLDPLTAAIGLAPGFFTTDHGNDNGWIVDDKGRCNGQYETLANLNSVGFSVPFLSCATALECFRAIREIWKERENWAATNSEAREDSFCSCIGQWEHRPDSPILMILANQALEMLMTKEGSECCSRIVKRELWNEMYSQEKCPSVNRMRKSMYSPSTSIRFLEGRNEYASAFVNAALTAKDTIDICTCYLFSYEALHRYILLDVLPYIARHREVKIRLLIDLMPIESFLIKSAILANDDCEKSKNQLDDEKALEFLKFLPPTSPLFSDLAREIPDGMLSFLNNFSRIVSCIPGDRLEVRWWCARDAKAKYRVKNHIKCHIFDGKTANGTVITGGSNLSPVMWNVDSDIILSGKVSQQCSSMFEDLWTVSAVGNLPSLVSSAESSMSSMVTSDTADESSLVSRDLLDITALDCPEPSPVILEHDITRTDCNPSSIRTSMEWTDESCSVAFLNSSPSSEGEDCILRHVIGAIGDAEKSVIICMGHSNIPMPMANALATATARGVHVRLLLNSLYSNDLRGGQRDLFLSLRDLLNVAPLVEVNITALPSHKPNTSILEKSENKPPPFLHSKYVVVDSEWTAVGSWNLWARAAFYEMEAEVFVYSKAVAQSLEEKFEREVKENTIQLQNASDTHRFCPKGCQICKQFGPFYR